MGRPCLAGWAQRTLRRTPLWATACLGSSKLAGSHRRALTISLNARWCQQREPPSCHLLAGLLPSARLHWSKRARRLYPRRSRWPGWPMRACRIGEAANPGPPAPGTPVGGERGSARERERSPASGRGAPSRQRLFCPVPGCLCADPTRAPGWANVATMRSHIDAHLSGSLTDDVPASWVQTHGRTRCLVCGLSVSERHGVHPTCHPEARAAAPDGAQPMDVDNLQLPSFTEIQAARTPTLRHVPVAARHTWNHILTRAGLWVVLAELHRPVQTQKGVWRPAWLAKGLTERRVLPYFPKGFAPKVIPQPKPFKRSIPGARHPVPHHSMTFPLARTSPLTWWPAAFVLSLLTQHRGPPACGCNS